MTTKWMKESILNQRLKTPFEQVLNDLASRHFVSSDYRHTILHLVNNKYAIATNDVQFQQFLKMPDPLIHPSLFAIKVNMELTRKGIRALNAYITFRDLWVEHAQSVK
jgi:hypothetical protein